MKNYAFILLMSFCSFSYGTSCWLNHVVNVSEEPASLIYKSADVIFVGEAIASENTVARSKGSEEVLVSSSASFNVEEWIKGSGSNNILVSSGKFTGGCNCAYEFEPGVVYLVMASKKDGLKTMLCKFIAQKEYSLYNQIKQK